MLRATCAIPFVFPTITIDGVPYYDGGLADPIPIRKAIADGNEKNLIILTRCKGYRKELVSRISWLKILKAQISKSSAGIAESPSCIQ